MACLHCQRLPREALTEWHLHVRRRGIDDYPYPATRTLGSSGPRLAPHGFGDGRLCASCGVLFFPPPETPEGL